LRSLVVGDPDLVIRTGGEFRESVERDGTYRDVSEIRPANPPDLIVLGVE
jgi:hypothetical protein